MHPVFDRHDVTAARTPTPPDRVALPTTHHQPDVVHELERVTRRLRHLARWVPDDYLFLEAIIPANTQPVVELSPRLDPFQRVGLVSCTSLVTSLTAGIALDAAGQRIVAICNDTGATGGIIWLPPDTRALYAVPNAVFATQYQVDVIVAVIGEQGR